MLNHDMELDGIKYSSVHTPWGPHPDLFNHPMNSSLRNSRVRVQTFNFVWVGLHSWRPWKGVGDLIRLRYLLLLFLHDVLTIFLFQGFPDKVITNLTGKTFPGKEATPGPQKIMFSLLDNTWKVSRLFSYSRFWPWHMPDPKTFRNSYGLKGKKKSTMALRVFPSMAPASFLSCSFMHFMPQRHQLFITYYVHIQVLGMYPSGELGVRCPLLFPPQEE